MLIYCIYVNFYRFRPTPWTTRIACCCAISLLYEGDASTNKSQALVHCVLPVCVLTTLLQRR